MTHETVCSFVDWRTSRPFLPRVLSEARKPQKPVDSTRPIWMLLHKLKVVGCVLHVFFCWFRIVSNAASANSEIELGFRS